MNEPNTTAVKKKNKFAEVWKRLCKNTGAVIGMIIILIFVLGAVFANIIRPYDLVIRQEAAIRLDPPSAEHWFGTDAYGRDVFARVLYGSRISLSIGFFTAAFSLIFGGILGAAGAYYGGQVDNIIMRVMDMFTAIPGTLLALAIVAALGTSMVNLLIAITISSIPGFVRLIRSTVLTVVESDYVEAARACGTGDARIILRHILPNAIGPIIVQTTTSISDMILTASGLSFIGMGVQAPTPEWGAMISEAREFYRQKPYLVIFPGVCIILTALSFNLIGDGLRDALDPRLRD
ncbi:MAG: ABC transporter permease [Clostridia bacterium]|nr:ABC transporter permease [Clostridia bacterium]MDY2929601.1 ABC transporter permease [Clostridiaceae bacterium]